LSDASIASIWTTKSETESWTAAAESRTAAPSARTCSGRTRRAAIWAVPSRRFPSSTSSMPCEVRIE